MLSLWIPILQQNILKINVITEKFKKKLMIIVFFSTVLITGKLLGTKFIQKDRTLQLVPWIFYLHTKFQVICSQETTNPGKSNNYRKSHYCLQNQF